jgi:hypothetical protein
VVQKFFTSVFLGIVFITSSTLAHANTSNSTTIGISVIVPERAEDQQCVVGFESNMDNNFTPMQNSGCRYNSKTLLQTAYQQATKSTQQNKNSQGFVTVVITAP